MDVDCSSLAPDEQKIIDGLPAVLNRILKQRIQPNLVLRKLDEIQASVQDLKQNPPDPNRGVLFPANDPNPFVDDWCETNIPKDWYRLYLGSFIVASPGFPLGGIVIRGKQVLGFRQHDGGIGITATVSSPDGKRVAFMKDNYFKLDDFFRRETPDKSTLNVFNETDDEPVLHVRYLNPKAILVTGKFSEQGLR